MEDAQDIAWIESSDELQWIETDSMDPFLGLNVLFNCFFGYETMNIDIEVFLCECCYKWMHQA